MPTSLLLAFKPERRQPGTPSTPSHSRSLLLAAFLSVLLLTATFGIALAHANLIRSNPPAGASLAKAPGYVQLWFSEELEPSFSKAVVLDANRQRVDIGDSHVSPNDATSLVVTLPLGLPNGSYVVSWESQSKVDGHIVRGLVPFGIGTASATSVALPQGEAIGAVSGTPPEMALRWLTLLAAVALVGSFSFWVVQRGAFADVPDATPGPPEARPPREGGGGGGDRRSDAEGSSAPPATVSGRRPALGLTLSPRKREEPGQGAILPLQTRLAVVAGVVFLLVSLALLLEQAALAADVGLVGAIGAPVVQLLAATQYGRLWIVRELLGAVVLGLLLARRRLSKVIPPATLDRLTLVPGLALLVSIALVSHGDSAGLPTPIGILPIGLATDVLHLVATAVWVGGLIQLAALVPALVVFDPPVRARLLGTLVSRFSVLAGSALAILGVTGLLEALMHVGTLDNLLNTGYGQALLVKILVIVPLVTLAAVNHYLIRPAFLRARTTSAPAVLRQALATAALFRWTLRLETLFAIGVIAVVGVLTSLSPAQQIGTATTGPLTLTATADDLSTSLSLAPGQPGANRYAVSLREANGSVATGIASVTLRFTFLDSSLGVAEAPLTAAGPGRYEGQSSDLAVAGRWRTEVVVRRTGRADSTATFDFQMTPQGARAEQPPAVRLDWLFYVGLVVIALGILALVRGADLRRADLRRAAAVAICGVGLCGSGAYLALRDVQQAQAQAAAELQARTHPATPQSIAAGAIVYRENCAICHGISARGDGPLAPSLSPPPSNLILHVPLHPDADLEYWIANGFPGSAMPAFQDKLTDQQRWDVLNYLKSLVGEVPSATAGGTSGAATPAPSPAAATPTTPAPGTPTGSSTPIPLAVVALVAAATATTERPTPVVVPADGGLAQQRTVGDLSVAVQIQPAVFQPAQIEIRLADANGKPVDDARRVDLQLAMEGMNHGARGIDPARVGPGLFRAQAMLLAMEGPWWLGVRVERGDGRLASAVFLFRAPRDQPTGAIQAMYDRPPGPVQIEYVAVYPGEVTPRQVAVTAGRPVRLEIMYVDHPNCGAQVQLAQPPTRATVADDGLAELSFVPPASARLALSCAPDGLVIQPSSA